MPIWRQVLGKIPVNFSKALTRLSLRRLSLWVAGVYQIDENKTGLIKAKGLSSLLASRCQDKY
ncbi:MAG: hypothetical protein K6U80_16815 [Firmicutes bacterium]|nr:hypothetical protein [Bacillota bacterium]